MTKYFGTENEDELYGTINNDLFIGSGASDIFYGSSGIDKVIYTLGIEKYSFKFVENKILIVKPDGSNDSLISIEQIQFGDQIYSASEIVVSGDKNWSHIQDYELLKNGGYLFTSTAYSGNSISYINPNLSDKTSYDIPGYGLTGFCEVGGSTFVFHSGSDLANQNSIVAPQLLSFNPVSGLTELATLDLGIDPSKDYVVFFSDLGVDGNVWKIAISTRHVVGSSTVAYLTEYDIDLSTFSVQNVFQQNMGWQEEFSMFKLDNGNVGFVYFTDHSAPYDPIRQGGYSDTRIQFSIHDEIGNISSSIEIGGSDYITDGSLKSSILKNGSIFVGWTGLEPVLDPNGGINTNGIRYNIHTHIQGSLINPSDPTSYITIDFSQNSTDSSGIESVCSLEGGGFVTAWSTSDGSGSGVFARIFDEFGVPQGDQFQLNVETSNTQRSPLLKPTSDGGFTCYWYSERQGGVFQRFDEFGNSKLINITGTESANVIFSDDGGQQVDGLGGSDTISTGLGDDILIGGSGADNLTGGDGDDRVEGGVGNDLIVGGSGKGDDIYIGGAGRDTIKYTSATASIIVDLTLGEASSLGLNDEAEIGTDALASIENFYAGNYADHLTGNALGNSIWGLNGGDEISGLGGDDTIYGGKGDDILVGGSGRDMLVGNAGADRFKFVSGADSLVSSMDVIADFNEDFDVIDVIEIDASDTLPGNDAFIFMGRTKATTEDSGEIWYRNVTPRSGGNYTLVFFDTDADTSYEFCIRLEGKHILTENDFSL